MRLLAILAFAGCIKSSAPTQAPVETPVGVVAILDSSEGPRAVPATLDTAIAREITRHNLVPTAMPATAIDGARTSETRLQAMSRGPETAVILVESSATFYAQVAGQFRWTVDVRVTLAPSDDLDPKIVREVEIPVFLLYYHQQEDAALEQAAPAIARVLGDALDESLGGR